MSLSAACATYANGDVSVCCCREKLFSRLRLYIKLRTWESQVAREGARLAIDTRCLVQPSPRRLTWPGIGGGAVRGTATIVGWRLLASLCYVDMSKGYTVARCRLRAAVTRARCVARVFPNCGTYDSTWRNTARSVSCVRSVGSGRAGPAPWCDIAGSARVNRWTYCIDSSRSKNYMEPWSSKITPTTVVQLFNG